MVFFGKVFVMLFCLEFFFNYVGFCNGYIWNVNVEVDKFFKDVIFGFGIVSMYNLE